MPDTSRMAAEVRREDGLPRFHWKIWDPLESSAPIYRQVMTKAIAERLRWRQEYDAAKTRASPTGGAGKGFSGSCARPGQLSISGT
ncbi:MAG TPA: hypothetical protein VFI91_12800 [Longimicrobiaceae bacterium]|nr:hypothetical protein [Longimicrobiaceae bacterium]